MAANPTPNYISVEEYLRREETAEFKSEYYNGEIFPMSAATGNHAVIVGNVIGSLWQQLKGRPCRVAASDLRLRVTSTGLYTYPDVMVICGEFQYVEGRKDTVVNPVLIVEVGSPTTRDYDRGDKFEHYRALPTVVDYLTVSQEKPHSEHWIRQGEDRGLLIEYSGMDRQIELSSIKCVLSLADIYDKIQFSGAAAE